MNIYGIHKDNASARAIINNAIKHAEKERYGGLWTAKVEALTGLDIDRSGADCGMEPERVNNN